MSVKMRKKAWDNQNPEYYKPGNIGWASSKLAQLRFDARRGDYEPPDISSRELVEAYKTHSQLCDICGCTVLHNGRGLALDHDHTTGEFRGWLCQNCNRGLGQFKDSAILLKNAAEYLQV